MDKKSEFMWVYPNEKLVKRKISYVPALYEIFDEILLSIAGNHCSSMNLIEVCFDVENNTITIYTNGGLGLPSPAVLRGDKTVALPDTWFQRAKLFSRRFLIEIADSTHKWSFSRLYAANKKYKAKVEPYEKNENSTKVKFSPDLEKFKMTYLEDDFLSLLKKRVLDMALFLEPHIKVKLDETWLPPIKCFKDYVDLYLNSAGQLPSQRVLNAKLDSKCEIYLTESNGYFSQVSFVNRIATHKGGTHVDYITDQIIAYVMEKVAEKQINVQPKDVKNKLWVFVNAFIDNPVFDSRTKETLTTSQASFGFPCNVPKSMLKNVENFSGIVELLSFEKKARNIYGMETRLVDAEEAGGINSEHCVLMVTEGNSAKSFAVCACGLSNLGYRHFFGVLALQGNLPNVSESSSKEVWKNENVQNLMKVLGLGQKKECTRKELRYGYLIIIPDPDMDGIQFKGLLINLFKSLWPSLLKVKGFLHDFMMPIKKAVRVTDGLSRLFYSMPDFESWDRNRKSHATSWKTIHYKGLGSFTKDEAVAYFSQMWLNEFIWEEDQEGKLDGSTLTVAYNKKGVDERKKLIDNSNTFRDLANDKRSLKNDFVLFWKANLDRSIAMIFDGLKLSQRKIIFSSFKKNLLEEIELKRFISYVSEHSAYDHGDQNLVLSTILMAQTFVGSRNNINLIEPLGQYGTRNLGGKDHAGARYLSTKLNPLTRLIFPEDDDPFLNYLNDDGRSIQPRWYLPIIPMVLVNGSEGIASGYSSYIPSYNPIDVIDNILRLLDNNQCKPVVPWYKDFKGVIHKSVKGWHKVDGNITRGPPGIFYVYELPLRKTTQAFKKFLQSKTYGSPEAKQPFIERFSQKGDDTVVHFTIKIMADKVKSFSELTGAQLLRKFKLTTRISTNNMHLLDADGQVQHYANIEEIMKVFFEERLRGFRDRGEHTIRNHRLHISILQNKVRYLKLMWDKGIEAADKYPNDSAPDKMVEELHSKEFTRMKGKSPESDVVDGEVATFDDYEYLLSLPYHTITEKTVEEMETEIVEKQQKLAELQASTPTEKWQQELGRLRTELVKIEAYTVRIEVAEIDNSDDI